MGKLCHLAMFRRQLYEAMDHLFRMLWNDPTCDPVHVSVRGSNEALTLVGLLPAAHTHLRSQVAVDVFATDASSSGGGVCTTKVSADQAAALFEHTTARGFDTGTSDTMVGCHSLSAWHLLQPNT